MNQNRSVIRSHHSKQRPQKTRKRPSTKVLRHPTQRQEISDEMAADLAGYKGLYGGLSMAAIKLRKGISPKENLMDRMDTTELIANQFRMSQTREKLKRESIRNQRDAMDAHEMVGRRVRSAIEEIGGTMPENIAPAEHIKTVEKRLKKTPPKLVLDDTKPGSS